MHCICYAGPVVAEDTRAAVKPRQPAQSLFHSAIICSSDFEVVPRAA